MRILRDLFDFSTERVTLVELSRKRGLLLLRWTLFASLLGLGVTGSRALFEIVVIDVILALFLLINIGLTMVPVSRFRTAPFEFCLGLFDTALISYIIYRADPSGVLCLFFFILLLSTAASTRMTQVLPASFVLSVMYLFVHSTRTHANVLQSVPDLMVLPFFYATALYFGYQVLQIRGHQAHMNLVFRERQEFKIILDVLESVTSSLDFHTVMFRVSSRIAEILDAMRCSILLFEEGNDEQGFVVASSDDPSLTMLPLELAKYPEVLAAIEGKEPVLIEDVEKSDIVKPLVDDLLKLNVRSLLVLPVVYRDTVIGTVFIRATRKESFSADDLRLCRAIASATASPIKNSILYRDLQTQVLEQQEMAAQLRSLFDNSPDLIVQIDALGNIRETNRAVERLTDKTYTEVVSSRLGSLISGLPPAEELCERASKAQGPLVYDARMRGLDGTELDLSVTVGAIEGPAGSLILIARDVTERKQQAARLHQTQKLSSIGEIVANVAHELNNPLAGVVGFSQLLAQKDREGRFRRETDRISQSADQCQKIVRNLLSFARPSRAEKKRLGLNGVLEKTLDLLESRLQDGRVMVLRDLSRDLPYIFGDFHEIQQVLTNLITNAQHAMSGQNEPGQLRLRTHTRDSRVVLELADNGPGIPSDVLPRIFDPFFSTKDEGRGTGLGLSVSHGIVHDHGGEILVDSELGRGTTFTVTFPLASDAEPAAPSPDSADPSAEITHTILAVDDEPVIIDLYLDLLRALGHNVDTASTGAEALRKIQQRDYDLILSDIKMPRMSGIELFEKAVKAKPRLGKRFIFVTGDVNSLTTDQHSILEDVPCLLKPVSLQEIETTIQSVLGGLGPHGEIVATEEAGGSQVEH